MAADDPQLKFRVPADLRLRLEASAKENHRSLSAEVVARLESTFPRVAYEPYLPERIDEGHDEIVARHVGTYRALVDSLYDEFEARMKADLDAHYAEQMGRLEKLRSSD